MKGVCDDRIQFRNGMAPYFLRGGYAGGYPPSGLMPSYMTLPVSYRCLRFVFEFNQSVAGRPAPAKNLNSILGFHRGLISKCGGRAAVRVRFD